MVTNRLLQRTFRASALLAVILLPVEHSLAATCCCCTSHVGVTQIAASSPQSCCSKIAGSCCGRRSGVERSCCRQGSGESGAKPCRCPAGCCGSYGPQTADPTATGVVTTDDTSIPMVLSTVLDAHDPVVDPQSIAVSPSPISGSQRCTMLCRYRR